MLNIADEGGLAKAWQLLTGVRGVQKVVQQMECMGSWVPIDGN